MPISRPCPKCKQPLEIPEPLPEKLQCSSCGTMIRFKAPVAPPQPAAPQPAAPQAAANVPVKPPEPPAPSAPSIPPVAATETTPAEPVAGEPAKSTPKIGLVAYLHTVVPKPIVFGFYGALGGLLGVLLLGELFWHVLHPTPQVLEPLRLAVAGEVTVFPGSRNNLQVKIKRQGFEGPVLLEGSGPADLTLPEVVIPSDEEEAVFAIAAKNTAERGDHQVKLRATAPQTKARIDVAETIKVHVEPAPPSMGITVSESVKIYVAGQNSVKFELARQGFEGPVRIECLDLPHGIHAPIVIVPAKQTKGIINVRADKDARLGANALPVEVRSLANHKIAARTELFVDVLPPPGRLQLAAAPQVILYPGTRNRFNVKIARQEFTAEIKIEVKGAPPGVTFSEAIIPADKAETDIEVSAANLEPVRKDLVLSATAVNPVNTLTMVKIDEDVIATLPLKLIVDAAPPTLQLAVSPRVPVYPEGKATFGVKINRNRFTGPVRVAAQATKPEFVKSAPITIPADASEGVMELAVDRGALKLPLKYSLPMQVTASSVDKGGITATEKVEVEILAPPSDLQLAVSPEVDVYQAGKCSFTIKVARSGFLGPVQVTFNKVPDGVTLAPANIPGSEIVLKGQASLDVAPKAYDIELVATGPKAPDGKIPSATKTLSLNVKKFDPTIRPPLDIVFVLDVTQSLDPQIAALQNGIGKFVQGLKEREFEARIGLIGFRDIITDEVPFERLKVKGEPFTTDIKAFAAEVGKLKAKGGGDDPESSLDAIVEATKYPFRPKALRVLLVITDEKPQTKGNSATLKVTQQALKAMKIDQVHLIIKKADVPNYAGLHQETKGGVFDFHLASKNVEGFASIFPLLSKEIVTTIGSPEPEAKAPPAPASAPSPQAPSGEKTPEPRAEAKPNSPAPVVPQPPKAGEASTVQTVDPTPPVANEVSPPRAEPPGIVGVQSTAVYAEKDRTALMIAVALWTGALAAGIALTLVGAQKRYLSQAWFTFREAARALAAGLVAGLVAGVIGQWFYQATSGSDAWNTISRVVAWVILGGLIGAAMGSFVPNMQWKRAVLGGCIGGLIGALGFTLFKLLADTYLESTLGDGQIAFLARLIGAALLGLFIGLMVAFAELASRRYWLEVAFGEREIRTVTLGPATVALGGDEKLAGVYVPNAPPLALGFRVARNRVYCEDFTTNKTTEASPGEQHAVANAKVKVCSAAQAEPTGANLQLVVVRDVALMVGMPLTADDILGLEAQGSDGIVALVSRRPSDPKAFLLRNRSKQRWVLTDADGKQRQIEPGLSIEIATRCTIDFGQVKGTLDPSQMGGGS